MHTFPNRDYTSYYTGDCSQKGDLVKKLLVPAVICLIGGVVITALWVELFVYMPARTIEKQAKQEGQKSATQPAKKQDEPRLK